MKGVLAWTLGLCTATSIALSGCSSWNPWRSSETLDDAGDTAHYKYVETQIEYTTVDEFDNFTHTMVEPPRSVAEQDRPVEYWDLTLQESVQIALQNSKLMRELGGLVLRTPGISQTVLNPAIVETNPQFGVAAALGAFDASFASSAFFEYNDRALNNLFFGGGTTSFNQDIATMQSQISKRAVTGTEFAIRNNTIYDANNSPGNTFNTAWDTNIEAEARHPLLFGSGVDFNRIAGPSDVPGQYNGVVLARINTDISLADFETSVRDFVSNVENAYWDLFFAYQDLEAKKAARDAALADWQRAKANQLEGREGGKEERVQRAREQYYRFKEQVQNALNGKLLEGTRTNNGSHGGTFRATGGVYVSERRLRLLMAQPINDGRLIRTIDSPPEANIAFDWHESSLEAMTRRVELRRQRWLVKQRELELEAAQKFLLPTLDAVGRYRWRGFGKDLFRQHDFNAADAQAMGGRSELNNAWDNLVNGDFQEWQLGMELSFPIGYRRAHAAVRNAELQLAREKTILREQEREIVHDLSNALSDLERAHDVVKSTLERRFAAAREVDARSESVKVDDSQWEFLLDARRRLSEADSAYYNSLVEYALAIKNVHFEKGSLLDYCEVYLAEGLWPSKAYYDAADRHKLRSRPLDFLNPLLYRFPVVSEGEYPQAQAPLGEPFVPVDGFAPIPPQQTAPPDEAAVPPGPNGELPNTGPLPGDGRVSTRTSGSERQRELVEIIPRPAKPGDANPSGVRQVNAEWWQGSRPATAPVEHATGERTALD